LYSLNNIYSQSHTTKNSVNLFLKPGGKSLLPTSLGGFIQANKQKLGCLGIGVMSPLSAKQILPPSNKPLKLSSVSAEAKLISSKSTQYP
jgi:hypothetical protein